MFCDRLEVYLSHHNSKKMKTIVRLFIVVLLATVSFDGFAQTERPRLTLSLNHIAIYVHQLQPSTEFYEKVLMLQKIEEPFHDGKHTWFTLGAAGQLHLIQGAEANIPRDKNDHLCFSVASIEDFISNLDKHGIEYTNWPGTEKAPTVRVDGVKQIYFQDPDGHWIEINNDIKRK